MSKVILIAFVLALGLAEALAGLQLDNESQFERDRADSTNNWYLFDYVGSNTIHYSAKGSGGASQVVSRLKDDQLQYVLYRLNYVEQGQTATREVFIQWMGPALSSFERRKKAALYGYAESLLQPFHAAITAFSKANFNEENIKDRSDPLSGSHVID